MPSTPFNLATLPYPRGSRERAEELYAWYDRLSRTEQVRWREAVLQRHGNLTSADHMTAQEAQHIFEREHCSDQSQRLRQGQVSAPPFQGIQYRITDGTPEWGFSSGVAYASGGGGSGGTTGNRQQGVSSTARNGGSARMVSARDMLSMADIDRAANLLRDGEYAMPASQGRIEIRSGTPPELPPQTITPREGIANVITAAKIEARTVHVTIAKTETRLPPPYAQMHETYGERGRELRAEVMRTETRRLEKHIMDDLVKPKMTPPTFTQHGEQVMSETQIVVMSAAELNALIQKVGDDILAMAKKNGWII